MELDNQQLIKSGPQPDFWRAPNDNDLGNGMAKRNGVWQHAGANQKLVNFNVLKNESGKVVLKAKFILPDANDSEYETTYSILSGGIVHVQNDFTPKGVLPNLPRMGTALVLHSEYDQFQWFGKDLKRLTGIKTRVPVLIDSAVAYGINTIPMYDHRSLETKQK